MSPAVFTIPAGESFVDALARRLLAENADQPLALADTLILLPTRRACRTAQDAFLRMGGGRPLLLPRLLPLGEQEEEEEDWNDSDLLPPAMPPVRRHLLLTRLVLHQAGPALLPEQAARLAAELGRLLDQVHNEELNFAGLAGLVPLELARHWQITLDFLRILTEHWPAILAEQGCLDAARRRTQLLTLQAQRWSAAPPDFPILAAGSTGSLPATARLLAAIARLPRGRVVLPGLDRGLDADAPLDYTHPQFAMLRLLQGLAMPPAQVPLWPGCRDGARAAWVAEALRPAVTTGQWRHCDAAAAAAAFEGVVRLECPGPREEAAAIALMLRHALEQPDRRAALVTPDRGLARRVAAELGRFGITIDDSGGRSLAATPPGTLLALTARMVADAFAPHATLAALQHPLMQGGLPPGRFRALARRLECRVLRGPRPAPGIEGMLALCQDDAPLTDWLRVLAQHCQPLTTLMRQPEAGLAALLDAHLGLVEALAQGGGEPGLAWHGEAGAAAFALMAALTDAAPIFPALAGRHYPSLLQQLMAPIVVRPAYGGHGRLAIWGPLEARLHQADLLILGGLNEGSWPPAPTPDPWMSRPMRQQFGLPPEGRRIGLAAHDFAQGLCAPMVALTRAVRADGAPTQPSRWLLRLDALLRRQGWPSGDWLDWAAELDRPAAMTETAPPAPTPPLAARPRRLPVTAIELWMRDPYGLYAERILKLRALEPIDADPALRDYGSAVHQAMQRFLARFPSGKLPSNALAILLAIGRDCLAPFASRPGLWTFWWPRFASIARWLVAQEEKRRPTLRHSYAEIAGSLTLEAPYGPFTVTATADRIDVLADTRLAVIDYKTGAPPSIKEVAAGFAPQLPLEAMIAGAGGFTGIAAAPVGELAFWRLTGGVEGGSERSAGADIALLTRQAAAGLAELVRRFDDPATAYAARPHPDFAPRFSDYGHLARLSEWGGGEQGEI